VKDEFFVTENLCKAILKESGETIASKSELAELRKAQADYEIALNGLMQYGRQAATEDWIAHRAAHVAEVREGGRLRDMDALTREQFELSYRIKSEACHEKMREVCQRVLPLADTICQRFQKIATKAAEKSAAEELFQHNRFGIAHKPSSLVVAFGKAAEFARARCPKSMYAAYSPRQLLPYLEI
jgi:hypothetical protein